MVKFINRVKFMFHVNESFGKKFFRGRLFKPREKFFAPEKGAGDEMSGKNGSFTYYEASIYVFLHIRLLIISPYYYLLIVYNKIQSKKKMLAGLKKGKRDYRFLVLSLLFCLLPSRVQNNIHVSTHRTLLPSAS